MTTRVQIGGRGGSTGEKHPSNTRNRTGSIVSDRLNLLNKTCELTNLGSEIKYE